MDEIAPDDTNDMMEKYGRKGKSTEKHLNKIQGTSDGMFAEKAKELKIRAVMKGKGVQLSRCLLALGVYLRKLFLANKTKEFTVDSCFGRFALVTDENADEESLDTMKIEFEPASCLTGVMETLQAKDLNGDLSHIADKKQMPIRKTIDYARLSKLCNL